MDIVELAVDDPRWAAALPVLRELRPHLTPQTFTEIYREGEPQGLRFTGAFEGDACLGVAGWRLMANTHTGRKFYVDDLVVAADARSRGIGRLLLGDLEQRARAAGCSVLDLDSGVQRYRAHRFYLRESMNIVSHHFARTL